MTRASNGRWEPVLPGWGLVHARNGRPIDPLELVSDEEIEMTAWELHQFAVQVVEQQLEKAGVEVRAAQGNLDVDPSIWIEGDSGPEWVVVRAAIYPEQHADIPAHWHSIVERCRGKAVRGHFASVAVARADANFAHGDPSPSRLLRGHGMHVRYTGLEEVTPTVNRSSALGMDGPINPPTGNPGTIPRPPRSNAQPRSTMRLTEGATQSPPLKAKAPVGAARVRDIQLEMPYRAVFVVVENWPSGTMAIKFGRAMKDALMVTDDRIQLVQMSPERIFRAVTNVTEQDFRASLSASGVSVPEKIGFVEL